MNKKTQERKNLTDESKAEDQPKLVQRFKNKSSKTTHNYNCKFSDTHTKDIKIAKTNIDGVSKNCRHFRMCVNLTNYQFEIN